VERWYLERAWVLAKGSHFGEGRHVFDLLVMLAWGFQGAFWASA